MPKRPKRIGTAKTADIYKLKQLISPQDSTMVPKGELNWNGILRNIREIKDLMELVLPEAGIIPDFSTMYA